MKIEELIDKYFEGETSCEEERSIRQFFSGKEIPEHLLTYKPMFAYFDKEITSEQTKKRFLSRKKTLLYTLSGIAACGIVAVAISVFFHTSGESSSEAGNYVMINGKCYTDEATIKAYANASFKEVATSKDEVFSELFND